MLIFCGLNFEPNGGGVVSWHIRTFRIADVPFVTPKQTWCTPWARRRGDRRAFWLRSRMSAFGHKAEWLISQRCPLSGVKQTLHWGMSANDPKRTLVTATTTFSSAVTASLRAGKEQGFSTGGDD